MNLSTQDARVRAPFASAHCVGIGGSGMTALAELLLDGECRISGSDLAPSAECLRQWQSRGLRFDRGHAADHVPANVDALIYSPAIPSDNPERRRAAERGIPQYSLPEALRMLMQDRVGISVAGTHGKSTTTAMIAWILQHAGYAPSAYIGGKLRGTERGGWLGHGEFFVAESCEFQRNFLQLEPQHAVVLGIEADHFDTFPDEESLIAAFAEFCCRIPSDGHLIVSADCRGALAAARKAGVPLAGFGHSDDAEWQSHELQQSDGGVRFQIKHDASEFAEIQLAQVGRHNVHNATAAVALCASLGLSAESIHKALAEFPGVCRRLECLGTSNDVTFFDDYAHHPTAVRVTLETLRDVFAGRRLWCFFQPHQIARVRRMESEFVEALGLADRVDVLPVYSARESAGNEASDASRRLVRCAETQNVDVRFCASLDRILPTIEDEARPGDVVVLMGAGDIERIRHELARRISRHHANQ